MLPRPRHQYCCGALSVSSDLHHCLAHSLRQGGSSGCADQSQGPFSLAHVEADSVGQTLPILASVSVFSVVASCVGFPD
jgi:hypothetical protein